MSPRHEVSVKVYEGHEPVSRRIYEPYYFSHGNSRMWLIPRTKIWDTVIDMGHNFGVKLRWELRTEHKSIGSSLSELALKWFKNGRPVAPRLDGHPQRGKRFHKYKKLTKTQLQLGKRDDPSTLESQTHRAVDMATGSLYTLKSYFLPQIMEKRHRRTYKKDLKAQVDKLNRMKDVRSSPSGRDLNSRLVLCLLFHSLTRSLGCHPPTS